MYLKFRNIWLALLYLLFLPAWPATISAANMWLLVSPDGRNEISVSLNGNDGLSYQVRRRGKIVIDKSPLGLRCDDQDFERALTFAHAGKAHSRREKYELLAGTSPRVDHLLNYRELTFRNSNAAPIEIDLATSDEGVAFRYHFTETNERVRIARTESAGFTVPSNARGWLQPYHVAGPYTPAGEDFYFHVSPGDPPPDSHAKAVGWSFPALFHVPDPDTWALLAESGAEESFCGSHLAPDSTGGVYRIAFPLADETTQGYTNQIGPEPRNSLPWVMPWRVIVLGKSAGDIATETLVTDLAPVSKIADTSWIKPGRASWAWWSYPDEPVTTERFNEFTDFAAKMGWEYTLFDAGWWRAGIKPIADHARAKGVTPLAWLHARDFYDASKCARRLDELSAAGVRGVKVDFWCSDRQEAITAQLALLKDAATRKMIVNLHGCQIQPGWERTWPNLLTREGVLGSESYFYEPHYTEKAAELDTVLPFTRNAVGPMDYTPIACSPKKYPRLTTAAHQLAAAMIFTSGIVHYADQPEFFESLPAEALQVLRDAPARWDETRCLLGEPGRVAVFARRSGASWFIAGINGTPDVLSVNLDLSAFKAFHNRFLISEGQNANMQVAVAPVQKINTWQHEIPSRGGFILRMDK